MVAIEPEICWEGRRAIRDALFVNSLTEPFDRGLHPARAIRYAQSLEPDFDRTERAQDHWRVDMTHMGDPERLA